MAPSYRREKPPTFGDSNEVRYRLESEGLDHEKISLSVCHFLGPIRLKQELKVPAK